MINLIYIRAAIEANTGVHLTLEKTRQYLLEEGLITKKQADEDAVIFTGYGDLFFGDVPVAEVEKQLDDKEGLPDRIMAGSQESIMKTKKADCGASKAPTQKGTPKMMGGGMAMKKKPGYYHGGMAKKK